MDRRALDEDELALLSGLQDGAASFIAAGAAALEIEWRDLGGDGGEEWPVFLLRPLSSTGLDTYWWMSDNPSWRREDMVVVGFAFGAFAEGIRGNIGASGRDSLVESVTRCVRALVEGRATYEASRADPENYDGPIAPEALELGVRWSFPTEGGGTGGAVFRAYLANPEAFTALTGIPIAAQLGEKRAFAPFGTPS